MFKENLGDNYYDSYQRLFKVLISFNGKTYQNYGIKKMLPTVPFKVLIGVDESTSQTGLCIIDEKGKPIFLVDLVNLGLPNARLYASMLRRWVENNFEGLKILTIVYEEVGFNSPQKEVKKKLNSIVDIFEDYKYSYCPSIEVKAVNNLTWKKHFLNDPVYKGRKKKRSEVKLAVQEEVCKRYPEFTDYQNYNFGFDSCDAVGIIKGYLCECFVDEDLSKPKINKIMKNYPKRKYTKEYWDLKVNKIKIEAPILFYNSELTLEDNCLRAINSYPNGVFIRPDSLKTLNYWKFDSNKDLSELSLLWVYYNG